MHRITILIVLVLVSCAPPQTFTPTPSPTLPFSQPTAAPTATPPASAIEPGEVAADKKGQRPSDDSLVDSLMQPFLIEAQKRRSERERTDPEYARRIDKPLNERRINFLLYGYGDVHEPPATERAIVGSNTIVSYDTRARTVDLISFTHDIRAPEIEREMQARGYKGPAIKMDQAYNVGGFRLMRKVLEDMTGLSLDFQVVFKDSAVQRFVDHVFGTVEVDVPETFDVHPFWLDGKKYEIGRFHKGRQMLTGSQILQFIKTTPITKDYYGKQLENNVRKHLVLQGLLEAIDKSSSDPKFWIKGSAFITGELATGAIVYDFEPAPLLINNLGSMIPNLSKFVTARSSSGIALPKIRQARYIVDPSAGDGGVRWADGDVDNPNTKRDVLAGVYPEGSAYEVPFDSNANGDLVTEYWPSVRTLIKKSLTEK